MDAERFYQLLNDEVSTYKTILETENHDWIVKGFVDVRKNIYTITSDTKVVSKIIEILLIPRLEKFALRNDLYLYLPSKQNYYPDLTFIDEGNNKFAVDFKSSYYKKDGYINGLTLGSYWGYFRKRNEKDHTDFPYGDYKSHLVIGMLYNQCSDHPNEKSIFQIDEVEEIKSVIDNFIFFVQPKWKIASDLPGSGNTRNIGGITEITKLISGKGPFTVFGKEGEQIFDDYWMNYYGIADARKAGMSKPHYNNLKSYKAYLEKQQNNLSIINIDSI